MRAGAQARTIFAGLGVTGCLIGGVGAIFSVTGGVLAFQGWPGAPAVRTAPALNVAAAARTAAVQSAPALQLAAPASGPVTAVATIGRTPARRPGTGRAPVTRPVTPPVAAPPVTVPATPAPGPAPPVTPQPPSVTSLAQLAEHTTSSTAQAVRQVGGELPAAQPVTGPVADTVDRAGHLLGPVLQSLSGSR